MGFFWLIVALIVLISLENQVDRERINKDYQEWKKNRK